MIIKILFFATLKERTGKSRLDVEMPEGSHVKDLRDIIIGMYPNAKDTIGSSLVAIDQKYAGNTDRLRDGAEVAFFPPVSGGSENLTICKIIIEPINQDEWMARIVTETTGAVCSFSGIVRGKTQGEKNFETSYLEYEAYTPMAEQKMQQIANEIRTRWPDVAGIVIIQRVGHLVVGTTSVWIACSAAHRNTGIFEAAHYGIDRLKEVVPIWKKEVNPQGEYWVEGTYLPTPGE
jgi:MoaE-MoaD fusion protein